MNSEEGEILWARPEATSTRLLEAEQHLQPRHEKL